MAILDATIVNVALPSIQSNLHASPASIEWIVSGYLLAFGLVLVPAGRLGDRIGHKPIFLVGITAFTGASIACGLSPSDHVLVGARIVQGFSAGLFGPSVQATIQLTFRGPARSRAFGILGTMVGVSSALGPILGGVILQIAGSTSGWRWVFFVNVFVGVVAIPMAIKLIPNRRPMIKHHTDGIGLLLITIGLLAIFVPLIEGQTLNWPNWTFETLIGSLPIFLILAWWESRLAKSGGEPILDPKLVRHSAFSAGTLAAMAYFGAFSSMFVVLSLLWQTGLGRSPLAAGLTVTPFAIGTLISGSISDRFSARMGRSVLTLGSWLLVVSLVSIAVILRLDGANPDSLALSIPLFVGGFGNGIFIAPNQDFILKTVLRSQAGTAAGLLQTSQRIGSALGVACTATLFFSSIHYSTNKEIQALSFEHGASISILANLGFIALVLIIVRRIPKDRDSIQLNHTTASS